MKNETLLKFANMIAKRKMINDKKKLMEDIKNNLSNRTTDELLNIWFIRNQFTKAKVKKLLQMKPNQVLKIYKEKRLFDITESFKKCVESMEKVVNSDIPQEIKISVEWKKNRTWGANPTAEIWAGGEYYKSRSIGGCGYDKESTATAECLNSVLCVRKALLLCAYKNYKKNTKNYGYEFFGRYGFEFSGGVGFNCHQHILENIGFKMVGTYGKMYNAYFFTRKSIK